MFEVKQKQAAAEREDEARAEREAKIAAARADVQAAADFRDREGPAAKSPPVSPKGSQPQVSPESPASMPSDRCSSTGYPSLQTASAQAKPGSKKAPAAPKPPAAAA
eukprot:gene136-6045_t